MRRIGKLDIAKQPNEPFENFGEKHDEKGEEGDALEDEDRSCNPGSGADGYSDL